MKKNFRKLILSITVIIYCAMGILHLLRPEEFLFMMPSWLPFHLPLIYISGIAEILLALLLLPKQTRRFSALFIVAMLIVYLFLIHIPQAIDFYNTHNSHFILTLLRIPLQFLFIYWIYPRKKAVPESTMTKDTNQ